MNKDKDHLTGGDTEEENRLQRNKSQDQETNVF